jgi:hypothetical protein
MMEPMATVVDGGLRLLLDSDEPTIRHAALTELLGRQETDPDVARTRASIADGAIAAALLCGPSDVHPYAKWRGVHWRFVSLMDLGVPRDLVSIAGEYDRVLEWLLAPRRVQAIRSVAGRTRTCGSQEGNALAVGVWLGRASDPAVAQMAANLVGWQWPDGGWNCDTRPEATHSSFNESLWPLLGLARYADETHDGDAKAAARGAAEFFLRHRVVFAERTGELAHPTVEQIHYPPYWHFDLLAGLRVLASIGHARDERAADALDLLERKRRPDGAWQVGGRWWRPPGSAGSNVEVVDWGGRGPSEPATLAALRILKAAGRWPDPSVIA